MPKLSTPLIHSTLDLDSHTRHFFPSAEHSAPIEAHFRLDIAAFKDMVFIVRDARFCTGALHLIIKEFTGDVNVDAKAPVMMSALGPFDICRVSGCSALKILVK